MKENARLAMKAVAGGKVIFCLLEGHKRTRWITTTGESLPRKGYDAIRADGWIRLEKLPNPPYGAMAWYLVRFSEEGRQVWMPQTSEASGVTS